MGQVPEVILPGNMTYKKCFVAFRLDAVFMVLCIVNLNVSDSIFLFNSNLGGRHIVNRNEMTKGGCITILNDDFPISSSKILSCVGHKNKVILDLKDMLINSLLKDYETFVQKIPVLKEIKRTYKEDGGPLIVIWKIR